MKGKRLAPKSKFNVTHCITREIARSLCFIWSFGGLDLSGLSQNQNMTFKIMNRNCWWCSILLSLLQKFSAHKRETQPTILIGRIVNCKLCLGFYRMVDSLLCSCDVQTFQGSHHGWHYCETISWGGNSRAVTNSVHSSQMVEYNCLLFFGKVFICTHLKTFYIDLFIACV